MSPDPGGMGPGPVITIRQAGADDLAAIAAVFLACWRTSYRGVLPERVIEMYDDGGAQSLWRRLLAPGSAGGVILVAQGPGDEVVGVIRLGRDPDRPSVGHVFSLYVDPATQGLGVGRQLLSAADARFHGDGLDEATLWVFEANAAARDFYARMGWQPDGAVRVEPQYGEPEVRLGRSVRAPRKPRGWSESRSGEGGEEGAP